MDVSPIFARRRNMGATPMLGKKENSRRILMQRLCRVHPLNL
jgi:hypothetical protein